MVEIMFSNKANNYENKLLHLAAVKSSRSKSNIKINKNYAPLLETKPCKISQAISILFLEIPKANRTLSCE